MQKWPCRMEWVNTIFYHRRKLISTSKLQHINSCFTLSEKRKKGNDIFQIFPAERKFCGKQRSVSFRGTTKIHQLEI